MTVSDPATFPRQGDPTEAGPRLVVVAAHPDDETISCGGLVQRLENVAFVHVTDGAPRDGRDARAAGCADWRAYAARRRAELDAALAVAGHADAARFAFEIADQRAALCLADLSRRLAAALRELRARAAVTHPYEGGHPDHDATCFAVHAASQLLAADGKAPELFEMTSYHAGPDCGIVMGRFLEPCASPDVTITLTPREEATKRRMIECFETQRQVLAGFPLSPERFRRPPRYDFTRPPHPGTLFYERYDWGMTGAAWRAAASAALRELGF